MKNYFKVVIVGGGASGLISAIEVCSSSSVCGDDVLILEKNDRVGKKLVATGNGQGNLTNKQVTSSFYHGDKAFIDDFISSYNEIDLINYLKNLGIYLEGEENGKMYPLSKQANSVLDILRDKLEKLNVNVLTSSKVEKVTKSDKNFRIKTSGQTFTAENVILAFGGKAGAQFGTDGSSYALAQSFGHTLTNLYPSLVQLKTDTSLIKGLRGIKEYALCTLFDGDKPIKQAEGDLLFTEYGVSGSSVFAISGYASELKNPLIKIEFLPKISQEQIEKILSDKLSKDFVKKEELLTGIVNKMLGKVILKNVKNFTVSEIASLLKSFTLKITGNTGFNNAQVTKGGIKTDKISKNFESLIVENLYITGEALNVDGDCGGYNLTFAFISGITASRSIKEKYSK